MGRRSRSCWWLIGWASAPSAAPSPISATSKTSAVIALVVSSMVRSLTLDRPRIVLALVAALALVIPTGLGRVTVVLPATCPAFRAFGVV